MNSCGDTLQSDNLIGTFSIEQLETSHTVSKPHTFESRRLSHENTKRSAIFVDARNTTKVSAEKARPAAYYCSCQKRGADLPVCRMMDQ